MPRLISRADLARLAKVTGAAVTKACRKQIADAVVGDRIHLDAPSVIAYLKTKGACPPADLGKPKPAGRARGTDGAPTKPAVPRRIPPAPPPDDGVDLAKYADMTLRELVRQFGTDRGFKDWLEARIKIETAREKRLANDEADGRLISREGVRAHVLGVIEACFRRLLQDTPRTLAMKLLGAAKGGATVEEAEQIVRDFVSSQLTPMKESAARALREG